MPSKTITRTMYLHQDGYDREFFKANQDLLMGGTVVASERVTFTIGKKEPEQYIVRHLENTIQNLDAAYEKRRAELEAELQQEKDLLAAQKDTDQ